MPVAATVSPDEIAPFILDERVQCSMWQEDEGDGRTVRIIFKRDGETLVKEIAMSDEGYEEYMAVVNKMRKQTPTLRSRKIWMFCGLGSAPAR